MINNFNRVNAQIILNQLTFQREIKIRIDEVINGKDKKKIKVKNNW